MAVYLFLYVSFQIKETRADEPKRRKGDILLTRIQKKRIADAFAKTIRRVLSQAENMQPSQIKGLIKNAERGEGEVSIRALIEEVTPQMNEDELNRLDRERKSVHRQDDFA